jgi:hypothetical protein
MVRRNHKYGDGVQKRAQMSVAEKRREMYDTKDMSAIVGRFIRAVRR